MSFFHSALSKSFSILKLWMNGESESCEVCKLSKAHSRVMFAKTARDTAAFKLWRASFKLIFFINAFSLYSSDASWVTIFAPGISFPRGTEEKFKKAFIDSENYCVVSFKDMNVSESYWNRFVSWLASWIGEPLYNRDCCLGQFKDIDAVKQCVDGVHGSDKKIILFGVCRGAAACLNYQARYNDSRVRAIVVDSGVFNIKQAYSKLAPKCIKITTVFPCFDSKAVEPIDAIESIVNRRIKILILHAKKDPIVSYDQALQFVRKCWQLGFDAQLISFDSDQHCKIFKESPHRYLAFVNEFYKKLV